jgi:beta-galactosidase
VEGDDFRIDFDQKDRFLCRYEVVGNALLTKGGKLMPNFWRAPSDNDLGANLQTRYCAWYIP